MTREAKALDAWYRSSSFRTSHPKCKPYAEHTLRNKLAATYREVRKKRDGCPKQ